MEQTKIHTGHTYRCADTGRKYKVKNASKFFELLAPEGVITAVPAVAFSDSLFNTIPANQKPYSIAINPSNKIIPLYFTLSVIDPTTYPPVVTIRSPYWWSADAGIPVVNGASTMCKFAPYTQTIRDVSFENFEYTLFWNEIEVYETDFINPSSNSLVALFGRGFDFSILRMTNLITVPALPFKRVAVSCLYLELD